MKISNFITSLRFNCNENKCFTALVVIYCYQIQYFHTEPYKLDCHIHVPLLGHLWDISPQPTTLRAILVYTLKLSQLVQRAVFSLKIISRAAFSDLKIVDINRVKVHM